MEFSPGDHQNAEAAEPDVGRSKLARVPNMAFTGLTLLVGLGIIVIMVSATLSPGLRPVLREAEPVAVLGATESPPATPVPETTVATKPIDPNDDWTSLSFGRSDLERGDDALLDDLATRCEETGLVACDDLVAITKDTRSSYEVLGISCGARRDVVFGTCLETFGPTENDDPSEAESDPAEDKGVGACVILPRSEVATAVVVDCARPHDAEVIAQLGGPGRLTSDLGLFVLPEEAIVETAKSCDLLVESLHAHSTFELLEGLRAGLLLPTTREAPFDCLVWAPGIAIEGPLSDLAL